MTHHSTLLIKKLFDHRPIIIRTKKGTKTPGQNHSKVLRSQKTVKVELDEIRVQKGETI